MPLPASLVRLKDRQDGLLHGSQLRAAALSKAAVYRLVAEGALEKVMASVYREPGAALTVAQTLRATTLWAGEGSALSYQTAAFVWGMDRFSAAPVHISVSGRPRLPVSPFKLVVHPNVRFGDHDVTQKKGLRVTSGARTVMDLASVLDENAFERAVDAALRAGATSRYFLQKCLKNRTGPGQAGIPRLRALMQRRGETLLKTGSPLETEFLLLFAAQKLPPPVLQLDFPQLDALKQIRMVDFAWEEERLAVEIDGFRFHRSRSAWASDASKHNALVAAGWRVLRLTAEHLRDPSGTADLIRAALKAKTPGR